MKNRANEIENRFLQKQMASLRAFMFFLINKSGVHFYFQFYGVIQIQNY